MLAKPKHRGHRAAAAPTAAGQVAAPKGQGSTSPAAQQWPDTAYSLIYQQERICGNDPRLEKPGY